MKRWSKIVVAVIAAAAAILAGLAWAQSRQPVPEAGTQIGEVTQPRPTAVFIGDSYTAANPSWAGMVAGERKWQPVNLARGGTGYVATAGQDGCGREFCPAYAGMIEVAAKAEPEIVFVAGGRNDSNENRAAIMGFYRDLRSALPDAQIYAMNPLWDDDAAPAKIEPMGVTVRQSVEAVGGTYVDVGQPLGGRRELIQADGVHPTADGQRAIADAVLARLA